MANWATQAAVRECKLASNGELTVVERLASLLETGQYADVTITVGDGDDVVSFKAHRLLLATASQPLNHLVASRIKNGPGEVATLRVTDVDPEAFQHILKYIYTDDIQFSGAGESMTLLKAGKKWGLQSLANKTVKFLDDFLNEYEPISEERKNELCDLTVLSEELGLDLSSKCWKVLIKNVNDVVPCQSFLNMPKLMIKRLLTHADFHFKDQLVLFEAIRDWGMNQVIQQNLSVNSLQGLIGEFLQLIDFKSIKDADFLDTILPSECLGKAELIAFFMTRGLEIPRDLVYNNKNLESDLPYEKSARYKRGYKLPNQEIYKEHELRFRVDKKLRLLGVGFGFLFSNTDMGITVYCKGPWETRQWSDIIQTYCRVSWEKMQTADVRLMFSEPVIIEPNHSYKILVRISRMSTGSSDVDLWGGTQGSSRIKIKGGEISFLKSAVDPDKEVTDSDTENKPGMITDLVYELFDESAPTTPLSPGSAPSFKQDKKKTLHRTVPFPLAAKKKPDESFTSHNDAFSRGVGSDDEDSKSTPTSPVNTVVDPHSQIGSTSSSSYSFRRNVPSARIEISPPVSTQPEPRPKKTFADEASSYYLATKPSSIRGSETVPAFLRTRQPSTEKSKPSWQIPSRVRSSAAVFSPYKTREPSSHRESSQTKDSHLTSRRPSKPLFDDPSLSRFGYGVSSFRSKYESNPSSSDTTSSRRPYESSTTQPFSSRYGSTIGSTTTKNEPRYGSTNQSSRYTSGISDSRYGGTSSSGISNSSSTDHTLGSRYSSNISGSRYGGSSTSNTSNINTPDSYTSSRYTPGTSTIGSTNKPGRERTQSPSRFGTPSPSYRYGKLSSQPTGREAGLSHSSSGTISSLGSSRYSTSGTSSSTGTGNRYGSSTLSSSAVSNSPATGSRYGSSSLSSSAVSNSPSTSSKYGSSTLNSSTSTNSPATSSRYGSSTLNTSAASSSPGSSSRYGSSTSNTTGTSSLLGSSKRYDSSTSGSTGTSSSFVPSRYGSSSSNTNTASTSGTSSTIGTRFGSSSSTPSYLSSNRYGTSSPFGSSYNSSNRFGSSIYRR